MDQERNLRTMLKALRLRDDMSSKEGDRELVGIERCADESI